MFKLLKNDTKRNNFSSDPVHFLRTEIDSTAFKSEISTTKMRKNKAEKLYFFQKIFQNIWKEMKPSIKISSRKNI